MPVRRPIMLCVVAVCLCCAGWSAYLHVTRPPITSRWIAGIYEVKENSARAINAQKLVIIGGSASHFSYSARVVARETGIPTVNLGTHAGLGADYLLERAKRSLKRGDIAAVAIEYQLLFSDVPTSVLTQFVPHYDATYMLKAGRQAPALLFGISPAEAIRVYFHNKQPWTSPLYRAETVDSYGDETAGTPDRVTPHMIDTVTLSDAIPRWSVNLATPPGSLRSFAKWATENGIKILHIWTPTIERKIYGNLEYHLWFRDISKLYQSVGYSSVGRADNYYLTKEEMLDSMYHANTGGRDRISLQLARDLCLQPDLAPCKQ